MDRVLSYAGSLYPMTHSTPAEIVSHADISSDQPSFLFVRFLPRRAGLSSIEPSLFPSVCATIHVYNVAERNGSILSNYLFRAKEKIVRTVNGLISTFSIIFIMDLLFYPFFFSFSKTQSQVRFFSLFVVGSRMNNSRTSC